jgi:hypothetical protein
MRPALMGYFMLYETSHVGRKEGGRKNELPPTALHNKI